MQGERSETGSIRHGFITRHAKKMIRRDETDASRIHVLLQEIKCFFQSNHILSLSSHNFKHSPYSAVTNSKKIPIDERYPTYLTKIPASL